MNHSQVEYENLRSTVSQLASGVEATTTFSRPVPLDLLRKVEKVCDACRRSAERYLWWAQQGETVLDAITRDELGMKIDPTGELDTAYGRTIEGLGKIAEQIRKSISNAHNDERLDGTAHRNDLVEAFSLYLEAVNNTADMAAQIRAALTRHDAGVSEVELSQEEFEHVQRCMELQTGPKRERDMAASVGKMRDLLTSRTSLSR
jgi:hypothetical protein